MKTLQVAKELSSEDLVRVVQDSEIVLMSNGHPVAFITPLHDDELYWLKRERSPEFAAAMSTATNARNFLSRKAQRCGLPA